MGYLKQFIDLRRHDRDPELFAIALALRHIWALIEHAGSDIGWPSDGSTLHPYHLEVFPARAVERVWKDLRAVQE